MRGSRAIEILIMLHNKNMATAYETTRSVVFSFGSTVVGLMACAILSRMLKLTDLTPSTDTFPTFAFTYLSHHIPAKHTPYKDQALSLSVQHCNNEVSYTCWYAVHIE